MTLEPTPAELEVANIVTAKRTLQNYLERINGIIERATIYAGRAKLTALQDALSAMHTTIENALPVAERIEPPSDAEVLAMLRQRYDEIGAQIAELEGKQ